MGKLRAVLQGVARSRVVRSIYFRVCLPPLRWLPFPSTLFGPVKGRHPSFAEWLENLEGMQRGQDNRKRHWILNIRPSEVVKEKPPVLAIPRLPREFSLAAIHRCPNIFVAHLHWGRIATRQLEVIAPDDNVFDDFFFSPSENGWPAQSLILPWLPRMKRKYGTYTTFASYRSLVNYYHWVINCLTRLWVLETAGADDYMLIIPKKLLPFQRQTIELLGFLGERVAPFGNEHWCVEHLIIPSYTMAPRHVNPRACQWLKKKLLSSIRSIDMLPAKRIYISRALASRRRLQNEKEVVRLLQRFGFVTVTCETLTVEEQAHLFQKVDVVVAPHGAGLTNILFMREGTLVIELIPYRKAKPHFCNLASAMGVKYACVTDAPERTEEVVKGRQVDMDFSIPVERLALALRSLGI